MPYKKIGPDKYRSPSGRVFTGEQIKIINMREHGVGPKKKAPSKKGRKTKKA